MISTRTIVAISVFLVILFPMAIETSANNDNNDLGEERLCSTEDPTFTENLHRELEELQVFYQYRWNEEIIFSGLGFSKTIETSFLKSFGKIIRTTGIRVRARKGSERPNMVIFGAKDPAEDSLSADIVERIIRDDSSRREFIKSASEGDRSHIKLWFDEKGFIKGVLAFVRIEDDEEKTFRNAVEALVKSLGYINHSDTDKYYYDRMILDDRHLSGLSRLYLDSIHKPSEGVNRITCIK